MIRLSDSARAQFKHLAKPPTHAALASRLIMCQEGQFAVVGVTLNYWYGTLDESGAFVGTPHTHTQVMTVPHPNFSTVVPSETIALVLANLFAVNVAPDPADPTKTVPAPGKAMGDCKCVDLDAVAAYLDPLLAGTVC